MCDRLDAELFAPLWQKEPRELADAMLDAGFEIRIIQVAAYGLDESWLGRTLDADALAELETLNEEYGVHILGEGGEFETIVVDGPHMARVIVDVVEVRRDGREVAVTLRIDVLEDVLAVEGLRVEEAGSVTWSEGPAIRAGSPATRDVVVSFDGPVPDLFIVTVDFGAAGFADVPVTAAR